MTALDNYKLTFESLENEKKTWITKTKASQQFKADQGGRLLEILRYLPQRIADFRSNNRTKED